MKKTWLYLTLIALLFAGCSGSSEDRLNVLSSSIVAGQDTTELLSAQITELTAYLVQAQTLAVDEDVGNALASTEALLGQLNIRKDEIITTLKTWEVERAKLGSGNDVDVGSEMQVWGHGIMALLNFLPPPTQPYGVLIAGALVAVGGLFSKRKLNDLAVIKTANVELVKSVDAVLKIVPDSAAVIGVLKENQSDATRSVVKRIKNPSP